MYINKRKHILSNTLLMVSAVNLAALLLQGAFRLMIRSGSSVTPDMIDATLWDAQVALSMLQLIITGLLFCSAFRKHGHYIGLVEEDDHLGMAMLQKEVFGGELSTLRGDSIGKLLQIWAVILVGARMIYDLCSGLYRQFIGNLTLLSFILGESFGDGFAILYNGSHGFKYIGMFVALLLGVMMTGIFLDDLWLKVASAALAGLFLLCFGLIQMETLDLFGHSISIVWTSVIFHLTDTLGLVLLSLYMRRRYKGV